MPSIPQEQRPASVSTPEADPRIGDAELDAGLAKLGFEAFRPGQRSAVRTLLDRGGGEGRAAVEQLSEREDRIGDRARALLRELAGEIPPLGDEPDESEPAASSRS